MVISNCSQASNNGNKTSTEGAGALQIAQEDKASQSMQMATNAAAKPIGQNNATPEKVMLKAMTIVDGDETYRAYDSGLAIQEFM